MISALANSEETEQKLVSFDGSTGLKTKVIYPGKSDFIASASLNPPLISRGAGLSYAAASFGSGVLSLDHSRLDRIIDFSESENWIEVEAGASLGKIYDFLIEKELFLATQPGHPRISVGGCIAADIHGKNQFLDGTFMNQLLSMKLFHPEHGVLELSRDLNPDLFRLSCGAYGLTGSIISAKLKLKKIPSAFAEVNLLPLDNIEDLPEMLAKASLSADFVLSWHDFTLKGKQFGRGFVQAGCFAKGPENETLYLPKKKASQQDLDASKRAEFFFPVFNPLTIKLMNMLYGRRCPASGTRFRASLFDSIFPIQNSKELYFKFFGAAGFHEYQVLLPKERFSEYIDALRSYLQVNPLPITLASGKLFSGKQDLLRFSGEGICFALNFPRCQAAAAFLVYLDSLMGELQAIPNIIKDSRLTADLVSRLYPEYDLFCKTLRDFDPKRMYRSELSERLAL